MKEFSVTERKNVVNSRIYYHKKEISAQEEKNVMSYSNVLSVKFKMWQKRLNFIGHFVWAPNIVWEIISPYPRE